MSLDKEMIDKLESFKKEMVQRKNTHNRNEGKRLQDRAKKMLGVPERVVGNSSQEEFWNSPIRFEVKSGKQVENIVKQFENCETQSYDYALTDEFNKSYEKPFSMVAMPGGTSDGLLIIRLSELKQVVAKLNEMWKTNEEGEENGMD
jgi:hypothetical protein